MDILVLPQSRCVLFCCVMFCCVPICYVLWACVGLRPTHLDSSCPAPAPKKKHAPMPFLTDEVALRDRRLEKVKGICNGFDDLPDCQNGDAGSCGNACCSLKVTVAGPPQKAMVILNRSFANGGADGHFRRAFYAIGVNGFSCFSPTICIGQVIHSVSYPGNQWFEDSVNFKLVPGEDGTDSTIITAFSMSLINGFYVDVGQNYKNLKMAMDHAFLPNGAIIEPGTFPTSCPAHAWV